MEVIQNADSNDYSRHDTPTVSIKVKPESVVIEYNGLGLSSENVRTICSTGQSSKPFCIGCTGERARKEFIGFDSVFKLANRVHIRSPPYYFQLDQRRELGMTTPQWDEDFFQNYEQTMQTTIVLDQINSQSSSFSTVLHQDLDAIDPLLLLSLLRIDRLEITSVDGMQSFSKCFNYLDRTVHPDIVSIKDDDSGSVRSFYKTSYTHPFVGTEDSRPHAARTNIELVFPVEMYENSGKYIPLATETCPVAHYWPMGDCKYKVRPYTVYLDVEYAHRVCSSLSRRILSSYRIHKWSTKAVLGTETLQKEFLLLSKKPSTNLTSMEVVRSWYIW
jgi:hypothetical protein